MRFKIQEDEIQIYHKRILGFQLISSIDRFEEFDGYVMRW